MIFATVGSMLPFDRLVASMDDWARRHPEQSAFIQIGGGTYVPRHAEFSRMLDPGAFAQKLAHATVIVAHAGMGTVISAAEQGKPIVLMPRRLALGEHTTDHQLHTLTWIAKRPGVFVAMDESALDARIEEACASAPATDLLPKIAPPEFLARLRETICVLSQG